jgi:nucleoredoxin
MSGDQDEGAYNAYFASMPWVSDGFNREFYQKKMGEFGIRGIPTFVLLKKDGTMASKDCRGDVMGGLKSPEAL